MTQTVLTTQGFHETLTDFFYEFSACQNKLMQGDAYIETLQNTIQRYQDFIMEDEHVALYEKWQNDYKDDARIVVKALQKITAMCVKYVENDHALKLIRDDEQCNQDGSYLDNVASRIQEEFGMFDITDKDCVLSIGCGSYPMTLMQVFNETGAKTIGLDIDAQSIDYARAVKMRCLPDAPMELSTEPVTELASIKDVTHVVISSTVPVKYQILDDLYDVTNDDVVVAMRYGNGLKSLFNYPIQVVDPSKWHCVEILKQDDQIFDIALYHKNVAAKGS